MKILFCCLEVLVRFKINHYFLQANFPHGIIDDIKELSEIAQMNDLLFHVDACLGGFLLPFMSEAGFPLLYNIDFSLPGISSISVDTHKYGLCPKGTSVLMFRNENIRKYMYFSDPNWCGNINITNRGRVCITHIFRVSSWYITFHF